MVDTSIARNVLRSPPADIVPTNTYLELEQDMVHGGGPFGKYEQREEPASLGTLLDVPCYLTR